MNLPNFLIIGANKAGTSSLAYYCSQHPDIFLSKIKEPMFFTSNKRGVAAGEDNLEKPYFSFTLKEYSDLFSSTNKPLRGEASTAYLANPSCALWIKKIIPDVKLIAVLRNPIERAFSNYKMYHGNGIEKRTFEEAIIHELEGGTTGLHHGQHYLKLGLYASQLRQFKKYFSDDQLFIGDFERFSEDTLGFMRDVFKYLGVQEFAPPDLKKLNTSVDYYTMYKIDKVPILDKSVRRRLEEYFANEIYELQPMVNFNVLKWL